MRDKTLRPLTKWLPKPWSKVSWRRWLGFLTSIIFLFVLICLAALYIFSPFFLKSYVESNAGRQAASRALSNAVKVDGEFSALHYTRWTIQSDSFQSAGWPGEAIAGLNCEKISVVLDPTAIFLHHAWRINSVTIDHAEIRLQPPDDALKRPPIPKKTPPWYLFFLPDHLESGPIVAEHADLTYTFRNQQATIHDAHVQADLIGKDLKYTVTSGVLNSPLLPPLQVNRLEFLVSRPFIKIYSADLRGLPAGDPALVTLSGVIGMRHNKAIDATVHINNVPIEQILPDSLRPLLQGRASGDLVWKSDSSGKMIQSDGELSLTGLRVKNLSLFKPLSALRGNLEDLAFDHANCRFHLQDGVIKMDLSAAVINSFVVDGTIAFDIDSRVADLDLKITHLVLRTWLPPEMKSDSSGEAQATIQWKGRMDSVKNSIGSLSLNLDGTQIGVPPVLKILLRKKQINKAPSVIALKTGRFEFVYSNDEFELNRCELDIPNILSLKMNGQVSSDKTLTADLSWSGLRVEDWLPASLEDQLTAKLEGEAHVEIYDWRLQSGRYRGKLNLVDCTLSYTSVQSYLGRFLSDRSLLVLPLTRAQLSWSWDDGSITISDLDLRAGDRLGVQGSLQVAADRRLSGSLLVGLKPGYLRSFYGLGDGIFLKNVEGLRWSVLHISGTLDNPQEDFRTQLQREMLRNPISALQLGGKMVSWVIGNWLQADDKWKRPTKISR